MATFAQAALAPAEIENIMIQQQEQSMDVVVEEDQLSLAIGRRGQNVRLAAMLSGYKVNIISKTKLQEKIKKSADLLQEIPGVSDAKAQVLVQEGVMGLNDLASLLPENLKDMLNIEEKEAEALLEATKNFMKESDSPLQTEEEEELISASAVPAYKGILEKQNVHGKDDEQSKFSDAEKRLREELAAFKLK